MASIVQMITLGSFTLCLIGGVAALSAEQSFYPPALNDTAYIANSSIGTYGGIYRAPTNGPTEGTPYGIYDYCSMPHPRSQEYALPEPLGQGRVKGKLVYLEYLQRHQRRSPYNILPGGEV
jgi:acid phosphatase